MREISASSATQPPSVVLPASGAHTDALTVCDEREAASRSSTRASPTAADRSSRCRCNAWRRSGGATVSRSSSASMSRRVTCGESRSGHPDLVERQVHVRVPIHHRHDEAYLTGCVAMETVWEHSLCELAQAVVQAVDGLYCCGRVEERRVCEGPLGHVDEHAHAVRNIFVERSLEPEHHARGDIVLVDACRVARHAKQRRPGRHESPNGGTSSRTQPSSRALATRSSRPIAVTTPDMRATMTFVLLRPGSTGRGRSCRAASACRCRRARSTPRRAATGRCDARTARARPR